MCLRWKIWQFTLRTDSATACGWLKAVFQKTHCVRTHALGEMLICQRIEMLQKQAEQECLELEVEFVESAQNKADTLTHMSRKWLAQLKDKEVLTATASCVEVTNGLH